MMNRLFLALSLFYASLFGYEYDKFLLNVQSNIFPKLILLDKDISKKAVDNEITLCIVYHPSDHIKSMIIKDMIEKRFGTTLGRYRLMIELKEFDKVTKDDNVNAYYILQNSLKKVKKICDLAKKRKIPTFSYDPIYFKADVLLSLSIQNSSTIYLNKKVYKQYDIDFIDIFYQSVKFFDQK
jgi:hypothetical protein